MDFDFFYNVPEWNYVKDNTTAIDYFNDCLKHANLSPRQISINQRTNKHSGAMVAIKPTFARRYVEDINMVYFNGFYPRIACSKKHNVNYQNFWELYEYCLDNYKSITDPELKTRVKMFINLLFGCVNHPRCLLQSEIDMRSDITATGKSIVGNIYSRNNVIYVDTDLLVFYKTSKVVINSIMENINLPYTIEDTTNGIFFKPKQYIVGIREHRGLKEGSAI